MTPPENQPLDYPFSTDDDPLTLSATYADLPSVTKVTVAPSRRPAWLIIGYEDVRFVRKSRHFSRAEADLLKVDGYPQLAGFMLGSDGKEHGRLRGAVKDAFTSDRIALLQPRVQSLTESLLDEMAAGVEAELVQDLAAPLTLTVIGELLGIPEADRPKFRTWGDAFLSTSESSETESSAAQIGMATYLGGLIATAPTEGLLAHILAQGESHLTPQEVISLCIEIMLAGWETTTAAISSFTYWLLTNDRKDGVSWFRHLGDHPEEIPRAVEELLRMIPIGAEDGLPRCATEDVELGGVTIHAGDLVLIGDDATHRDPQVFPEPSRIDLRRYPNRHMAFGYGTHYCLGANLARLELAEALRQLVERFPDMHVAIPLSEMRWKRGTSVRGPLELPVRLK